MLDNISRQAWLERLIDASEPAALEEVLLDIGRGLPGCRSAWLLRRPEPEGAPVVVGDEVLPTLSPDAIDALLRQDAETWLGEDAGHLALCFDAQLPAALLLEFQVRPSDALLEQTLRPSLRLAERQLRQLRVVARLQDSHRRLKQSADVQCALYAISQLASSDLDMPRMLSGLHDIMRTLMYAENFFIVRCDPLRDTMYFLYYVDSLDQPGPAIGEEMPLEQWRGSLIWHLITEGRSLMGDAEELSRQAGRTLTAIGPDSEDWLGVPMMREGQVQGALVVQSYRQQIRFTAEDRSLLGFVASHILTALERKQNKLELERRVCERTRELAELNRGLEQEVQERRRAVRLQEALFHLAQLATADIDEQCFYEHVHEAVRQLLDAENFFIALFDRERQNLLVPYVVDRGRRLSQEHSVGGGLSRYVLRRGEAWLGTRQDIERLYQRGEVMPDLLGESAMSWLGVPLRVDEQVIGLVAVQSYADGESYSRADMELLGFAALQIANSIYRRRSAAALHETNAQLEQRVEERTRELRAEIAAREQIQQQLQHQILHDPLTGLPNRGYLRDRLEQVMFALKATPGQCCALLYIDVDRFKTINDSLGHLAGDIFLKAVAERLRGCVREPDVVARLSGDEFAILLERIDPAVGVEVVAQRVLQAMSAPLDIDGREIEPSVSLGIALGDGRHEHPDELVRAADLALYRAKELGRKRYTLFDDSLNTRVPDAFLLESELRRALLHDEFVPYFQPIRRLEDDHIVGYEALLRWNHPRRGLLKPGAFLREAQESGHLDSIDWRLFKRACRQFQPLAGAGRYLTLNVSPRHLRNADFDRRLLALLERVGFTASGRLEIEVTEDALLDDVGTARDTLERLHEAGIEAALDDFGTGYSSLSRLLALPLRTLKIDQSFVQSLDARAGGNGRAVVAAILALGRALHLQVIAEGIETPAQRQILLEMGCELGQGYLLGRPAPAAHWTET